MNLLASFGEVASSAFYIFIAILVLLIMITVHEFGHYIVGRIFHFGIDEFAIGFGPKLFSKKRKSGEVFSIRLLPLGGFCAFTGENEDSDNEKAFNNFAPYKRILVLIAGAFMNYVLAVLIIVLMFSVYGQSTYKITDVDNNPNYSVEESLNVDDVILRINGKNVYLLTDMMNALNGKNKDDQISALVIRNGQRKEITVRLREDVRINNVEDSKPVFLSLGIFRTEGEYKYVGLENVNVRLGFFETIGKSFEYSFKLAGTVFAVLGQLLTGKLGISSVGGTITTITVTADAVRTGGFSYLLYISSFIGVNLAVFNLLPIPALDGSHVLFTLIEWIRKKPINRKVEAVIHAIGFALILVFAIFVDLQRCF